MTRSPHAEPARTRAELSRGSSNAAIYRMVESVLREKQPKSRLLVDVGCGGGKLFEWVRAYADRYVGADLLRYEEFPRDAEFVEVNLDQGHLPFADGSADVVTCVETIEHVENPRALMRELVRVARPGGLLCVTTPNQLSLASKLCFLLRDEFLHFQERPGLYPAHITALLEIDLRRMANELGLTDVDVIYSAEGRIPLTARRWPSFLAQRRGRRASLLSDNVLLAARKPLTPAR